MLTLLALIPYVQHCPNLRYLGLFINVSTADLPSHVSSFSFISRRVEGSATRMGVGMGMGEVRHSPIQKPDQTIHGYPTSKTKALSPSSSLTPLSRRVRDPMLRNVARRSRGPSGTTTLPFSTAAHAVEEIDQGGY
jgi:hypothetical protein